MDPRSTTPTTRVNRRPVAVGGLRADETPFQPSHLAVSWRGSDAKVRLRMPQGWTRWHLLGHCDGARDTDPVNASSSVLLGVAGATGYEVSADPAATIEVTELDTARPATGNEAAAVASAMPLPDGTTVAVPYLSRAAWGADEGLRMRNGTEYWPAEYQPVQTLTVHHTAGINDDPDPAATVRAIYYYQAITRDWGDIGYNLLIDEAGRVYEGRWSGDDAVPAFPGTVRWSVVGGHVQSFNAGNIGVCLLGNFTSRTPTNAARQSLIGVLAGLAGACRLDVLATVDYLNPTIGTTARVNMISGHRDWAATSCPGDMFYPQLASIRTAVKAIVPPPPPPPPIEVGLRRIRPDGVPPVPRKPRPPMPF
jgi:hypothetical protein